MQKKIIFYLNMFLNGGIETSLINLLSGLQEHFAITLLICINMNDFEVMKAHIPAKINVEYVLSDNKLLSNNYYNKRKRGLNALEKLFESLIKPIRKNYIKGQLKRKLAQYDVIVDYSLELLKYNLKLKFKPVGYFHYSIKEYYAKNPHNLMIIKKKLSNYDKIIVLNQQMLKELVEVLPEYKEKSIVLYNQLNFNKIRDLSEEDVNLEVNADFILSVGRLEENQKDFTTLIKAFKLAKERYNILDKLVIIGSGVSQKSLEDLVKNLNLSAEVYFLGHKSNPYPWFKGCKTFVLSSKFEGLAMVLVEAMHFKKPIIASDCPNGPREVLKDGANGILFPVGDVEQLAIAINEVPSNNALVQQFQENMPATLHEFDLKHNLDKIIRVLT